jgi:hypothetical protein
MKPFDAYLDTANRARLFLEYHDGLMNTRARGIRRDWKSKFLSLMHWPVNSAIERVDSAGAVIVLKEGGSLTPDHFTQAWLDDQLRAALIFGVSALDRYVHERVVKGIIPALKNASIDQAAGRIFPASFDGHPNCGRSCSSSEKWKENSTG